MNPYEILGVSNDASNEDIRKAYRELAKKYHPDVNSDTRAVEKITEINAAYEQLTDPEKKKSYDNRIFAVYDQEFNDPVDHYDGIDAPDASEEIRTNSRDYYQAQLYVFLRKLCYPIAALSLLVIIDFFLPARVEFDYPLAEDRNALKIGYGAMLAPYMKTNQHEFEVPADIHHGYDYRAKEKKLICMEFTPIFNTLKRVGVDHSEYMLMYRAPGSIYAALLLPVPYALLALCILLIRRKEYTKVLYSLSLTSALTAVVFFALMYSKHVA